MLAIKGWFNWLVARPFVTHLIRAVDRFTTRLGSQFAAAITYFSFLAVVPIVMVSFSVAGFVLASQPGMLSSLRTGITSLLPGTLETSISNLLDQAINARFTVGAIGLVVALYSGVSWMGNLRSAIEAIWRPDVATEPKIAAESWWRYYLKSLRYLGALAVGIALSLALTAVAISAQNVVRSWFGLDRVSWLGPVFTVVPIVLAVLADMVVFVGLYRVLPPKGYPAQRTALLRGSAAAAIAFELLKFALTLLLPTLLRSTTAKIFGPIIGLLFFFNLVATLVLFVAAWIATAIAASPAPELPPEQADTAIRLSAPAAGGLDRIADTRGVSREVVIQTAIAQFLADPD